MSLAGVAVPSKPAQLHEGTWRRPVWQSPTHESTGIHNIIDMSTVELLSQDIFPKNVDTSKIRHVLPSQTHCFYN